MRTTAVAVGILLQALTSATLAVAREHPRDFPNFTLCPIHLGWSVDDFTGDPIPDSPVRLREPDLVFVAAGRKAVITFLACNETVDGSQNHGPVNVRIDDVAVVERTAYEQYQAASVPSGNRPTWCYFDGFGSLYDISVGSVFAPPGSSRVRPFTRWWPFFDDFENPARTGLFWKFVGARVADIGASGQGLILAEAEFGSGEHDQQCGLARLEVSRLQPGAEYVVDFKWSVFDLDNGMRPLITYIDTTP